MRRPKWLRSSIPGEKPMTGTPMTQPLWTGPRAKFTPRPKSESAGVAVITPNGDIVIRKVAGGYGGYDYSFAKGRVDQGENPRDAAKREALEELGVVVSIMGKLGTYEGDTTTTTMYWGVALITGMQHDEETEWVETSTPGDAFEKLNRNRDRRILTDLMDKIRTVSQPGEKK